MVTVKRAKKNIYHNSPAFVRGAEEVGGGGGRSFHHNAFNSANDFSLFLKSNALRITSYGRALDCRAGSRGFDSLDRTNTHGLKKTEK